MDRPIYAGNGLTTAGRSYRSTSASVCAGGDRFGWIVVLITSSHFMTTCNQLTQNVRAATSPWLKKVGKRLRTLLSSGPLTQRHHEGAWLYPPVGTVTLAEVATVRLAEVATAGSSYRINLADGLVVSYVSRPHP